jgi:hypothetical protein
MYIKKKDDNKKDDGNRKDENEKDMSIKELLDMRAGIDAEGKPLKYPDEDAIISKIVDYEETVEILKEVLITSSFKDWWDKNYIKGVIVDHDAKIVVISMPIEILLNYSILKRLGIFAMEFGYTVTSEHVGNL